MDKHGQKVEDSKDSKNFQSVKNLYLKVFTEIGQIRLDKMDKINFLGVCKFLEINGIIFSGNSLFSKYKN